MAGLTYYHVANAGNDVGDELGHWRAGNELVNCVVSIYVCL